MMNSRTLRVVVVLAALALLVSAAQARNPIRREFFNLYPGAAGTQLDDLPSNAGHCGVCHFDFDGGGTRNAFGINVEAGLNNGLTNEQAILAIENDDSDADGYPNLIEITSTIFGNTPTFPGLSSANYTNAINVTLSEVAPYLTPSGGSDTTPPVVEVTTPNGGETVNAGNYQIINFTATDASGISHVDILLSTDGGLTFKTEAANEPGGTGFSWFVPNRPGTDCLIKVIAYDNGGNAGFDVSDGVFTLMGTPAGYVPTTLNDMDMSGTQPHEGAILDDPDATCGTCHGGYDTAVEPWHNWRGSMMGQAARDPFFFACMAIAEQDAPSVGDLCIKCHTPGGWQEGRSVDTSGDMINVVDRHGVQCVFCHRAVDHEYVPGVSPAIDLDVLANIVPLPLQYGNGQFINDPAPIMRGPYGDAQADHAFIESDFHKRADLCGLCHDVSSPVFNQASPGDYVPNAFNEEHPDMDIRNMMPVERTFSEWSQSEYATIGVYQPQFAGNKPDGIVSTCQDCHMRDVTGRGAAGGPLRTDMGLHDFTGGNTFVPSIVAGYFPDEVEATQLADAIDRARAMLAMAATVDVTPEEFGITVRVTNETGHKLPSGYPEGRRVWLNVQAYDIAGVKIFESGEYDFTTAELFHDGQEKIYEIQPGVSPALGSLLGFPAGKSFHFVLSDTVFSDNRIPPRGSTNAGLQAVQSPVVAHTYADGQYWDDTEYTLPAEAESVYVTLYYQTTTKEYIEFLRDENTTNSAGQDLYADWIVQGMVPPEVIGRVRAGVEVTDTGVADEPQSCRLFLAQNSPNPFNPVTTVSYGISQRGYARMTVYDVAGRVVRVLVDAEIDPGEYLATWDGRNEYGSELASGVYYIRYDAGSQRFLKKAVLLR